jgi:mRNA degradation ribonuclease J1/J2
MRITVYDGATTIGGNKIYLEEEGKGIFLDFGMNFARHRLYYDFYTSYITLYTFLHHLDFSTILCANRNIPYSLF